MADRDREYVEFVQAASGSLRRTAFLVCGDWHRADDVVQDALYKLYRSWPKVDRGGNPLAYARRVVVNAALDSGRRPWRREVPTADLPADRGRPGDHAVEQAERDEVLTALGRLAPRQRACVVLRYYEDLSVVQRDPMPARPADQLRNCSVQFWSDLRTWRVVVSETVPNRMTSLIAVSPSGQKFVHCELTPKPDGTATPDGSGPGIYPVATFARVPIDDNFPQFSLGYSQGCTGCETKYYAGYGRVDSNIARIRVAPVGSRNVHDITVRDGWFVLSWFDPDPHGTGKLTVTAYDKNGNVLKTAHS